jgi:hypothetical protein
VVDGVTGEKQETENTMCEDIRRPSSAVTGNPADSLFLPAWIKIPAQRREGAP